MQRIEREGRHCAGEETATTLSNADDFARKAWMTPRPAASKRRCLILANAQAGALSSMEFYARMESRARAGISMERSPVPGTGSAEVLSILANEAAQAGIEANVEAIPSTENLAELMRAADQEGYDTIVAAGGDGTVRSIAQSLIGSRLSLGILPVGSANNTARALGIPFDLSSAMRILADGVERQIDVGKIGNECFLEAAGVGLFADALSGFGTGEPHRNNILKLIKVCAPLCWNPRARSLQLTLDGVVESEEVVLVTISNSAYVGEGWKIAPEARLTDGKFDVVIAGAMSRWELIRFMLAASEGKHLSLPKVRRVQASVVEIRRIHNGHEPIPVHADDHIAAHTPVRLEVAPRALRVLAPANSPGP